MLLLKLWMEEMLTKKRIKKGCYHCGSNNHQGKNCPVSSCRLCGKVGHNVGGCPERPESPVDTGEFLPRTEASLFTYAELFAGMGGFRVALDKLGGHCVFASEIDRFCVRNYQANFGDRPAGDITRIRVEQIADHDLLVGGFPCQPFSSSGAKEGMDDPRGVLFREICRILKAKRPSAFLLENVRGLLLHNEGKTLGTVTSELGECGYIVYHELVDAVNLLPQERCRLFLVGIRSDLKGSDEFVFPFLPKLQRGVKEIIQRNLSAEEINKLTLSQHQLEKVQSQPYTRRYPEARFLSNPDTSAKTLQSSYASYMVGSQFIPVEFGNDSGWRRFSSREAARLQGFPEEMTLCPERAYHMIGNSVAPPVVAFIAGAILQSLAIAADIDYSRRVWTVVKEILVKATPDDSRRETLQKALDSLSQNSIIHSG